ncbi:hypothetical protein HanPI659440_Chr04g0161851 [Helianthus annuus]|nr:hypothetical protein HanIR_Chr04g0179171 [Helianthus annuus]KAJ0796407.1 hypothetical protein HanPI659440_Chr04g0161851 [Helianthus annuus]
MIMILFNTMEKVPNVYLVEGNKGQNPQVIYNKLICELLGCCPCELLGSIRGHFACKK